MGTDPLKNWAKNLTFNAAHVHRPSRVEEVQERVRKAEKVRALGTRHSFGPIADTPYELISTELLTETHKVDRERRTVSIQPGVTYGRLSPILDEQGFALPNLASLPHISVVGACATATHGSGVTNRNLADSVASFEIVTADGSLREFRRGEAGFDAVLVGLGGFGVITKMTLDLLPTFEVQQEVYERLPYREVAERFDDVMSGGYSVSLFWDWQGPEINQVWVKRKIEERQPVPADYFGAVAATRKLHPLPDLGAENCTEQLGIPGPWYERLPHFRMAFTPSSGEELQSEFFVKRSQAPEALDALADLAPEIAPLLFITEIRTIAADELWMSPQHGRDSVGIHFTWKQMPEPVVALLPRIESRLAKFNARPHWGKMFTYGADWIGEVYPKAREFRSFLSEMDPTGKFDNPFLREKIPLV